MGPDPFAGPPLLLDAALGTELTRRGADTGPPLWSARALREAPDLVARIHEENAAAGADVLTTATFRTHARNLRAAGIPGAEAGRLSRELARLAVTLAREGGRRGRAASARSAAPLLVAGSLSPLSDCWRPDLVPEAPGRLREHAAQAEALALADCDLILVETMGTAREALDAVAAAAETGLPVAASFTTDGDGRLLSGEPLVEAARALLDLPRPPTAVGVNCVPARRVGGELARLAEALPGVPLAGYGNTGQSLDDKDLFPSQPIDPDEYAVEAARWLAIGARLVGGCCGTTAAHTAALRAAVDAAR